MPGAVTAGGKWINHGDIPTHFYAVCALCGHIGEGKLRQYTDDDRCPRCQGSGQAFLDGQASAARVRAAAPDLLMALEELVDLMEAVRSGEYRPDSFTAQPARAAIAKAKGEPAPSPQVVGQPPDGVPPRCPVTGLAFFCMEMLDGEQVPTYGGPCDSYTIPEPDEDHVGTYIWRHYDHDAGNWADGWEVVLLPLIKGEPAPIEASQAGGQPPDGAPATERG